MPAKTIKAIETEYKGYRFRSRLEARWAVFFDALIIPFEYEKEGFDMDGLWYLPDFWLPEQNAWLEIKGPELTDSDKEKAVMFRKLRTEPNNEEYFILRGDPYYSLEHGFSYDFHYTSGGFQKTNYAWVKCPLCLQYGIRTYFETASSNPHLCGAGSVAFISCSLCSDKNADDLPRGVLRIEGMNLLLLWGDVKDLHATQELMGAYTAARGIRFDGR